MSQKTIKDPAGNRGPILPTSEQKPWPDGVGFKRGSLVNDDPVVTSISWPEAAGPRGPKELTHWLGSNKFKSVLLPHGPNGASGPYYAFAIRHVSDCLPEGYAQGDQSALLGVMPFDFPNDTCPAAILGGLADHIGELGKPIEMTCSRSDKLKQCRRCPDSEDKFEIHVPENWDFFSASSWTEAHKMSAMLPNGSGGPQIPASNKSNSSGKPIYKYYHEFSPEKRVRTRHRLSHSALVRR